MARAVHGGENSGPPLRTPADRICQERDGRMLNPCSMLLGAC